MSKVKFIILIFKTRWEKIFLIRIKKKIHKQGFTPNYFFNVLHHGTYCSINTLRRYINHESSSWHLLFNEHTQTLYQPWIIIMAPTVLRTHSDAISTMNHPLEVSVRRLQNDYEILKIIIDIIFLTIENQSELSSKEEKAAAQACL